MRNELNLDHGLVVRMYIESLVGTARARKWFKPCGPGRWNPNSKTACDCGRVKR